VLQAKHLALALTVGMLSSGSQGCHYTEKQRPRSLQPLCNHGGWPCQQQWCARVLLAVSVV